MIRETEASKDELDRYFENYNATQDTKEDAILARDPQGVAYHFDKEVWARAQSHPDLTQFDRQEIADLQDLKGIRYVTDYQDGVLVTAGLSDLDEAWARAAYLLEGSEQALISLNQRRGFLERLISAESDHRRQGQFFADLNEGRVG